MIVTNKRAPKRLCWSCRKEAPDLYFCSNCASLQPLPPEIDYFTCFGLEPRLNIDLKALEPRFYELSRKFHPDFYQKRSEAEKAISLENAAILNKAYRALKYPRRRLEYLIGWVEGGEPIRTEAPADLFDEIFELQETLEEAKAEGGSAEERAALVSTLEGAREKFQKRRNEESGRLETLFKEWDRLADGRGAFDSDRGWTGEQKKCLEEMKKALSHQAYLDRILNDIDAAAPSSGRSL